MTRTIKKWLIAVLLFVMAVAIGFSATAFIKAARAAETLTDAQRFDNYISNFAALYEEYKPTEPDGTFDSEGFTAALLPAELPEDSDELSALRNYWRLFQSAKIVSLSAEEIAESQYKEVYDALETVFGKTYSYYAQINNNISVIAEKSDADSTYADNEQVSEMRKTVEALTPGEKNCLNYYTNSLDYLVTAEAKMATRKEAIDAVTDAINAIQYYDANDKALENYDAEDEDQIIVLKSEESIDDVATALEDIRSDERKFVTNMAVYTAAATAFDDLKTKASDVSKKIEAVYDNTEAGKTYYSLKDEIVEVSEAYVALAEFNAPNSDDTVNYNDLQALVDEATKVTVDDSDTTKLVVMLAEIAAIEEKIAAVVKAIEDNDIANPVYKQGFKAKLDEVNELYAELDADIKSHDEDLAKAEETNGYYVTNYAVLYTANAQYSEWNKAVEELIEAVKTMIANDAKDLNVKNEYLNIDDEYNNNFTAEQRDIFDNAKVEYKGAEVTCKTALLGISRNFTANEAKVGTLNNAIHNLYTQGYTFANRVELEDYKSQYEPLSTGEKAYVTYANELEEMWTKHEADKKTVAAWQAAVEKIGETVHINNVEDVEVAEEAWKALDEDVQAYIEAVKTEADEDSEELSEEDVKYAADYATYTTAVAAKEYVVEKVEGVLALINKINHNEDGSDLDYTDLSINDVADWAETLGSVEEGYNALAEYDGDIGMVSYEGAQDYIKADPSYDIYVDALKYIDSYGVEALIANLWKGYEGDINFASTEVSKEEKEFITYKLYDLIKKARKEVNEYLAEEDHKPVRNEATYLKAAEERIVEIEGLFDKWNGKVTELLKNVTKNGSGLDLDLVNEYLTEYADLVYSEWVESNETDDIGIWAVEGEGEAATYVLTYKKLSEEEDKAPLDTAVTKLTEYEKLIAANAASNTLLAKLDTDMGTVLDEYNDSTKEQNYTLVKSCQDAIVLLSESQKAALENLEGFEKLEFGVMDAVNEFKALVETVVAECNNNLTSLTPIYLDLVDSIYNSYTEEVQSLIGNYNSELTRIRADYEAAVEGGTLVDYLTATDISGLTKDIESLNKLIEELQTADTTNKTAIAKEIEDRMAAIKASADALTEAYGEADEAIQTLLTAKVDDLSTAIYSELEDLAETVSGMKTELEGKLTALETKVNAAIEKATADLKKELEDKISTLTEDLEELVAAEEEARELGDDKLAKDLAKAIEDTEKLIDDTEKALAGDIKTVSDGLTSVNGAIETLDASVKAAQTAINELKTSLTATEGKVAALESENEELKKEIEGLRGSIGGLVAGVVIVGVVLGLAIAGYVVLTVLGKKKN